MSVMGFQKKEFGWVGGWGELYPNFFWIIGIFLTLQSPYYAFIMRHMSRLKKQLRGAKYNL